MSQHLPSQQFAFVKINLSKYQKIPIAFSLFVVSLIPRINYAVNWNLNWYFRSIRFWDALLSQNWADTFQRYHPGVTTMWVSGVGIKLFEWMQGYSSEELLAFDKLPAGVLFDAVTAGVIALAVVISLGIVLPYFLLADLLGKKVALLATFFIALDPFFINHSKAIHLDALMSILMLITFLLFLAYRKRKKNWMLIAAGVFTSFSLLTKSPSTLLVPIGILLITNSHKLVFRENNTRERQKARISWLVIVSQKLAIWGFTALATFFIFWPAMWIAPKDALFLVYSQVFVHTTTPHPFVMYFNGTTTLEDPGIFYYFATILLRTTLVTFPLLIVGLAKILIAIKKKQLSNHTPIILITLFGVLFLLQMSISEKKAERYILPIFLIIDVVAAYGLVQLGFFIRNRLRISNGRLFWSLLLTSFLIIQALLVLPSHPYYGNNYNPIFGGIKEGEEILGLQNQAEGIDLAGQYLDSLPDANQTNVAIFSFGAEILYQHFRGNIRIDDEKPADDADYRIYYASQIMRGLGGQGWKDTWQADQLREPVQIIEFDDIPYVWIYR